MNTTTLSIALLFTSATLIAFEALWSWRKGKGVYDLRETLANLSIMVGGQALKPASLAVQVAAMGAVSQLAILHLEKSLAVGILAFVATDFVYYWAHRLQHEVKALWTLHLVHHSSPWMNLSTSFRINWVSPFVGFVFYIPLILLGLPPELVGLALTLNLAFQFFLHTEAVGTLGPLEGILNTPSAHRVHHGSNPQYLDKNYGGTLMIWDRLFGTWEPEGEAVRYGVTTGFAGHNPLKLVFQGFVDYARGRL